MKTTFHNGCVDVDTGNEEAVFPFPNCMVLDFKNIRIIVGILPMKGNTWETRIMYRKQFGSYTHNRFLIFAIAWITKNVNV